MKKTTEELLNEIKNSDNIEEYIDENTPEFLNLTFLQIIQNLLEKQNLKVADIAALSNLGEYAYKIFSGTRNPSRDNIVSIGAGFNLSLAEVQTMLRSAQKARLDPRDKRDSIIIYGLNNSLTVNEINDILDELSENTL